MSLADHCAYSKLLDDQFFGDLPWMSEKSFPSVDVLLRRRSWRRTGAWPATGTRTCDGSCFRSTSDTTRPTRKA